MRAGKYAALLPQALVLLNSGKSPTQVARELSVRPSTVHDWINQLKGLCHYCRKPTKRYACNPCLRRRQKYYQESIRRPGAASLTSEQWDAVDWTRTNAELSAELNVSVATLSEQRSRRGKQCWHQTKKFTRWEEVDWTLTDNQIAKQLKVGPSSVQTQRIKRGLLNPLKKRWQEVDWKKPVAVLAKELKVSIQAVNYQKRKYAASVKI